jgi:hypothetical protein
VTASSGRAYKRIVMITYSADTQMTIERSIYKDTEGVTGDTLPLFFRVFFGPTGFLLCFERFNEVVEHLRGIRRVLGTVMNHLKGIKHQRKA